MVDHVVGCMKNDADLTCQKQQTPKINIDISYVKSEILAYKEKIMELHDIIKTHKFDEKCLKDEITKSDCNFVKEFTSVCLLLYIILDSLLKIFV